MAVTIRLMRYGKRNQPSYRIVVLDRRKKRDGEYLEKVGLYDPAKEKDNVIIDKERVDFWISRGAILSEGLSKLIRHKKKQGLKKYKKVAKKPVEKSAKPKKHTKKETMENATPVKKLPRQEG